MILRDLELGAMQAHILWHAAQSPVYGVWMAEELARHGYTLSCGMLYPTLHRLTCIRPASGLHPAPGFTSLSRGGLRILLNQPGAGGAGQAMPDGQMAAPGG